MLGLSASRVHSQWLEVLQFVDNATLEQTHDWDKILGRM